MNFMRLAKSAMPYLSSGAELLETPPIPQIMPLDKKVESITTSAYLALLGMNAYGEGAKLQVADNTILFNLAEMTQAYTRWSNKASNHDFKTYKILTIAIEYPQSWYKLNSVEAQLILRIHNITKLGLEYIKKTYENKGYLPDYIETYLQKCKDFEEAVNDTPELPEEQSIEPDILPISNLMKECWSKKKYERLLKLLDDAYEEFISKGKPSEKSIAATTKFLTNEVDEFRTKLIEDYNNRYDF